MMIHLGGSELLSCTCRDQTLRLRFSAMPCDGDDGAGFISQIELILAQPAVHASLAPGLIREGRLRIADGAWQRAIELPSAIDAAVTLELTSAWHDVVVLHGSGLSLATTALSRVTPALQC